MSKVTVYSWSELFIAPVEFYFGPSLESHEKDRKDTHKRIVRQGDGNSREMLVDNWKEFNMTRFILSYVVSTAVFLKSSPLPDRLAELTEESLVLTSVLDQHYAIKNKIQMVGRLAVDAIINIVATMITACLQFMIAYHNAEPAGMRRRLEMEGRIEKEIKKNGLVTFSIGGYEMNSLLDFLSFITMN